MTFKQNYIKHNRVLQVRQKMLLGWTPEQLMDFCLTRLKVCRQTANDYIDDAALKHRKKYKKEHVLPECTNKCGQRTDTGGKCYTCRGLCN